MACTIDRILKTGTDKQLKFRMLEEVRLRDLDRRHLARSYDNLVVFSNKYGSTIPDKWMTDAENYRKGTQAPGQDVLARSDSGTSPFPKGKRDLKKNNRRLGKKGLTKGRGGEPAPRDRMQVKNTTSIPATPQSNGDDKTDTITPTSRSHRNRTRASVNVQKSLYRNPIQNNGSQRLPEKLNVSEYLRLSEKQEVMVSFFIRQLQCGQYAFRPRCNTALRSKKYYNLVMHGCVFTVSDVAEFVNCRYCSNDLVKASAMCTYKALKQSSYQGDIRKLLVILQESEMQVMKVSKGACIIGSAVSMASCEQTRQCPRGGVGQTNRSPLGGCVRSKDQRPHI